LSRVIDDENGIVSHLQCEYHDDPPYVSFCSRGGGCDGGLKRLKLFQLLFNDFGILNL
jgi:hypothetical protein